MAGEEEVVGLGENKDATEEAVKGGLSTIAIVGIVVACVVVLVLAAIIGYFVRKKCRKTDGLGDSDASIKPGNEGSNTIQEMERKSLYGLGDSDASIKPGNEGSNTIQEMERKSLLSQITIKDNNSMHRWLIFFDRVLSNAVSREKDPSNAEVVFISNFRCMANKAPDICAADIEVPPGISNRDYIRKGVANALNEFLKLIKNLPDLQTHTHEYEMITFNFGMYTLISRINSLTEKEYSRN